MGGIGGKQQLVLSMISWCRGAGTGRGVVGASGFSKLHVFSHSQKIKGILVLGNSCLEKDEFEFF